VLRAQVYQHLADARTHLQQVFDELPTGLALTDGSGTLLRANPAWWRLWGIEPETADAINLIPWDILPHILVRLPDPLAFSDLFTKPITTPNEAFVVLQNPWQELRILLMPVRDTLGHQAGFLLAVNDVTREREVDRLKSEFVSVVSHELRTPLTSILGYTELLLAREFGPAERREFIQTVHKEADHLANLVEDLLNVSRLDAGKIKLDRWVMALPKLVRELVAQLNAELDVERHRLLLDVRDTLPPIYADRDRVRQILSNLLSNAIKYSPEGGEVVLHASVLHRPPASAPPLPPEPAMLISVRDQGIGIPSHELSRIFERFYRVDNSNTRRIGGTGLGLAITRALVELHGGRIWVESTPGEGSTFYVTLPLATEMLRTRP
jgi:signal transduction histidine kinase